MTSAHTNHRIATVIQNENATRLVELCGGDRLDAWRIALGKAVTDPQLADHWIEVADAISRYQTIPTPSGIALMLADVITDANTPISGEWDVMRSARTLSDPRVKLWAKAVRAWGEKNGGRS